MSHLLDRLNFLKSNSVGTFADGHGNTTDDNRDWEDVYRNRWRHDKIVRSTHGVNCTGSCSWKIYVKSGIVTWETQQTDYPRTRAGMPNHEPRGCTGLRVFLSLLTACLNPLMFLGRPHSRSYPLHPPVGSTVARRYTPCDRQFLLGRQFLNPAVFRWF